MKLRLKHSYYDRFSIFTIEQAVIATCSTSHDDQLNEMRADIDAIRRYLAKLTERLIDNGTLKPEDVRALLPDYEIES